MSVPMSQVLATARTYLNDDFAQMFPDPVLIPFVQEAHREMQTKLWLIGSPVVRGTANTTVNIAVTPTAIATSGSGDFLFAFELFEAPSPAATPLSPVTEVDFTSLNYVSFAGIGYWCLAGQGASGILTLFVSPTTANRYVLYNYRKLITIPVATTDLIGVLGGEQYLAPRSAALAAEAVGNNDLRDVLTEQASTNFADVLFVNRGQQKPVERP